MTLRELTVEQLAVVDRVRLELAPGFTVLTGETGAGKSLVVDAVALALGARASADLVRAGTDAARVEAVFDAPPVAEDDPLADIVAAGEGTLIVRREVAADGRSSVRVNDRAVTVGGLASLGGRMGEIHGQHDQQRLLEASHQLALLDAYGGHEPLLTEVASSHRDWRAAVAASSELLTDARELARRIELLRHQAGEIGAAAPRAGEDAELEAKLRAAAHAETIVRSAQAAVAALRDDAGAADALGLAERGLVTAAAHDDRFGPLAERAASLVAEAAELARDAGAAAEAVELDPASRAAAEERLALLYDLRRKYGDSLEAVVAFGLSAADELERLENADEERARLTALEEQLRGELDRAAAMLSAARLAAADRLTSAVNAELPPLGLPAGAFGVVLEPAEPGSGGADLIAFTFAPNPGEPPRPLARIASGGEASRVSLALKVVLAAADATPLLVFDEIDAGIGGRNALELGQRLRALSAHHQVLCVTHLPQVAAHADAHIVIGKREVDGRTVTEAHRLGGEERAGELAAMLAGDDAGSEARAAADALLRAATR
ncbi:MAG: DNA repair protein RecN [Chloroflexi bacterium]|nr:DNA repair protein RecN [Chloroflexota bacterium]